MKRRRPRAPFVSKGKALLNIDYTTTPVSEDIEAAKAWALLGLVDALGDFLDLLDERLPARHADDDPADQASPTAETGAP